MTEAPDGVQCAVIYPDSLILLGSRKNGTFLPGLKAFPGGKCKNFGDRSLEDQATDILEKEAGLRSILCKYMGNIVEQMVGEDDRARRVHLYTCIAPSIIDTQSAVSFNASPIGYFMNDSKELGSWDLVSIHNLMKDIGNNNASSIYPTTKNLLKAFGQDIINYAENRARAQLRYNLKNLIIITGKKSFKQKQT
ncbi:MAG: hypothetical protein WCK31_02595 [bacterium]